MWTACQLLPALILPLAAIAAYAAQTSPVGLWQVNQHQPKGIQTFIRVGEKKRQLSAVIERILDGRIPINPRCTHCPAREHPRPLLGMELLRHVTRSRTIPPSWGGGSIFDSQTGRTYSVKIWLSPDGKTLFVRGFLAFEALGKTRMWTRVPEAAQAQP